MYAFLRSFYYTFLFDVLNAKFGLRRFGFIVVAATACVVVACGTTGDVVKIEVVEAGDYEGLKESELAKIEEIRKSSTTKEIDNNLSNVIAKTPQFSVTEYLKKYPKAIFKQNKKPWEVDFRGVKRKIKDTIKDVVFHEPTMNQRGFEEGVGTLIPYKGSVEPIVEKLNSGLRRAMWYTGAKSIKELKKKSRIVLTTSHSINDNIPRILND